ncbi:hydroxypyruvate isomerase [Pseudovibrio exalbescens]|uniref:hydroxypyruvate isomerase n=1 Tax=Pseudovibrio exalbescens TaxID=197461 RepID=UPI0023668164|nr:hydroxypyruvate isomerase [Pseudovibrio exalbescens]MDD7912169.1 hydroxypyruvate isomerase [Pseudovibrio exalbescens]
MPKLTANLSMLFTELDFMQRFEAAAAAGFKGVEYLFPYDFEAQAIKAELDANGLQQVLFNLPAGDWAKGERGIACLPGREEEFRTGVDKAIAYAKVLGNTQVNCLAGFVPAGVSHEQAEAVLIENLRYAAPRLKEAGILLLLEACNTQDMPGFCVNTSAQALRLIKEVGSDNLQFQYDIYHMQIMEGNIARTLKDNLSQIAHVQLADNPGRHEPGTGELNYSFLFKHLDEIGYQGWVGAEYIPSNGTVEGLGWLKDYKLI